MKTSHLRANALACALLTTTAYPDPAMAQVMDAPPAIAAISPGGVNFDSGAFHLQEAADLSIGGDSLDTGLQLRREYQSNLAGHFSSGLKSQGWTHNLHAGVTVRKLKTDRTWPAGMEPYLYSVSVGGRSVSFTGGSTNPTGGFVGNYSPVTDPGTSLSYSGTHQSGTFTFTDREGSVIVLTDLRVQSWTRPSGVVLNYHYNTSGLLKGIFSSLGYALVFEGDTKWTKACAVNLAQTYVAPGGVCPSGAQSVSYAYSSDNRNLTGVTNPVGQTTQYEYVAAGGPFHLTCVKRPGRSTCEVTNQYDLCVRDPALSQDPAGLRNMDRVIHQQKATGETYTYEYSGSPYCPRLSDSGATEMTISGAGTYTVTTNNSGAPVSVTDPLGRTTTNEYLDTTFFVDPIDPRSITYPEGNKAELGYNVRRNLESVRNVAKPGSTEADLVSTSSYSSTCPNIKTCNKPASSTDARDNTTNYTWDAGHGGLLTEMQPAPTTGAARPLKIFTYVQKSAYVKNSSGTLVASPTSVWLPATETICETAANSSTPVCSASGPQMLTTFEYGPNGTANNLRLRSKVVTADGISRRTCFRYDNQGNQIAETSPRAGLTTCS